MKKVLLLIAILSVFCSADVITVDDDAPADFSSIQDAINSSWDGDRSNKRYRASKAVI